ncbi:MAG: hypothetical protein D6731_15155 [Planctomycetota bacterium]|nr:MAG: hypothetical protein D6731_15155 [Planctomycetota bacterium]
MPADRDAPALAAYELLAAELPAAQARAALVALLAVGSWERTAGASLWPDGARTLRAALGPARACGLSPLLAELPEDRTLPLDAARARLAGVSDRDLPRLHQRLLERAGNARRRQGSFYTPAPLCEVLAHLALAPRLAQVRSCEELCSLRLVDPAAGAGDVLLALLACLESAARRLGAAGGAGLRRRLAGCLVAADRDPCAVVLARLAVQRWAHAPGAPPLPLPWILWGDALLEVPTIDAAPLAADAAYRAALGGADEQAAARALEAAQRERCAALDEALVALHGEPLRAVHWRALLPDGVDAVVGNPPYLRERDGRAAFAAVRRAALGRHARSRGDLWYFFTHLALDLLRPGGRHVFLVPSYWLRASGPGPRALREALAARARWRALVDLGALSPFGAQLGGRHVVFAVERGEGAGEEPVLLVRPQAGVSLEAVARAVTDEVPAPGVERREVAAGEVAGPGGEVLLDLGLGRGARRLLDALEGPGLPPGWLLSEGVTANPERVTPRALARLAREAGEEACAGLRAGQPVFVVPHGWPGRARLSTRERREHLLPWLRPLDVGRLRVAPGPRCEWLLYLTPENAPRAEDVPTLVAHLRAARPLLERRRETRRGRRAWFHLHWPRRAELFRGPRVLIPRMVRWPGAALCEVPCASGESVLTLVPRAERWAPLLAALLSSLPFAARALWTSKRRGRGIDLARGTVAGFAWPSEGELDAAAADLAAPRVEEALDAALAGRWGSRHPLALAAAAARRLERAHGSELGDAPFWDCGAPGAVALGRFLDEAACRALGLPYARLAALAEGRQRSIGQGSSGADRANQDGCCPSSS